MPEEIQPLTAAQRGALSIRDALESDAWRRYPTLAARLARRRGGGCRKSLCWQDRVLLTLAIALLALLLLRVETAAAEANGWGLHFSTPDADWRGPALETRIDAEVSGRLARVTVRQSFLNRENDWAEAVYRFPLPDGAAVDRMQMQVGDRLVEGVIQPRDDARRSYQHARSEGRSAALVEQQRANQFQTSLANIGPGERVQVMIGFLADVGLDEGRFTLRLPLTFTPRWADPEPAPFEPDAPAPVFVPRLASEDGAHGPFELELQLRAGYGLAAIESRYHDVDILPEDGGYRVRLRPGQRPDRDFELSWSPAYGAAPQPELRVFQGADAIYAQLTVIPPLADRLEPLPRELVFVIDTSGSMAGESLKQATAALRAGLTELAPGDHFNLVHFSSRATRLFKRSRPADAANIAAAESRLARLSADGGTDMAPALAAAFGLPAQPGLMRQVVFITDGAVSNEQGLLLDIARQLGEARLFTVSIGSAPNSWFMRRAAEIGRGTHTHVGAVAEVRERLARLWREVRLPALASPDVDWGVDAETYPEVIPDLYAGQPLILAARLPLLPGVIELSGTFNGAPWSQRITPRELGASEVLGTLWARRKIAALEDSVAFGADPGQVQNTVTALGLDFGLLTRHTALVALERTPARPPEAALTHSPLPSLLPAGSTMNTAGFPPTATGWRLQALLSLLALGTATGLLLASGAPGRLRTSTG